MKREIKLRAWCEDFGEYKMCHYKFNPCDNGLWFEMIGDFHSSETHDIMECVGMEDVSGVDIFESDIIVDVTLNYSFNWVVGYHAPFFDITCIQTGTRIPLMQTDKKYKVIGNTYENREMLVNKI